MTVLMTPDMANFAGNVHGGTILKFLDQVAYACASRYASRYVVTLSVDQVMFRQPIYVGELVTFLAAVNHTGTSSMEVGIKVLAENIRTQDLRHANSCFFTIGGSRRRAQASSCATLAPVYAGGATPACQRLGAKAAAAGVRHALRVASRHRAVKELATQRESAAGH